MTFRYSVGLQNVGSYQVSGRPFLKDLSLTGGQKVLVEFPNVTNKIKICNDHNGSGHELEIMFCEPRRAIDFTSTNEYLSSTFSSVEQFTVSAWIKLQGTIANLRLIQMTGGVDFRLQTTTTPNLRLIVNGDIQTDTTLLSVGQWINVAVTSNGTDNNLYLNGQLILQSAGDASGGFTGLDIGGSGIIGYDGTYDELVLFSTALDDSEVAELYNNGAAMKIQNHSQSSSLVSHWAFEDNNYKNFYATPDATNLIYDRISGNNLNLTGGALTPLTFVDGRAIENAEARHKITLSGQEQITLSAKCKQIFLHALNNLEVGIDAPLTGIPANRMFELTGPGIDV